MVTVVAHVPCVRPLRSAVNASVVPSLVSAGVNVFAAYLSAVTRAASRSVSGRKTY